MNKFFRSVKGKIIVASVLGCLALFMAWVTSKDAFQSMLTAFERVSAPNEKLRIINELSRGVLRFDQPQKISDLNNRDRYNTFINDTKKLSQKVDTLKEFYGDKPMQLAKLNQLQKLLYDRDKLFIDYLKVREGLVNNKTFTTQIKSLNEIVNTEAGQEDSLVTATERKTSTTTIYPKTVEKPVQRGFFSRLFGKKKDETQEKAAPYQIVKEELRIIKSDTITSAIKDSLLDELDQTIAHMDSVQQAKSTSFINRETVLIKSGANVMQQIVNIIKQVEADGVAQTALNSKLAKDVVANSIKRISLIMLAFLIITIALLYFILTDISRINRYRQEIEQAKEEAEYHAEAKHRFLSNMSHELRTPLQSIIGYAERIKQQLHPQKKDIEAIYKSSGHLMQIVNEVLDYNRIISGKFTFEKQRFNLQETLDEVIEVMQLQAINSNIKLKANYDKYVNTFITGDSFRLKQILYNLLGNAIKFTNEGSVLLSAKSKLEGDLLHCFFTITDTGVGLTEQEINRIFLEFEQAGAPSATKRAGTGLGLPITRELIESQGGTIQVKSQPGKGSEFSFNLTYEIAAPQLETSKKLASSKSVINSGKVWMIDDDPFILELCSGIFDSNNVPYQCFTSPYDMLDAKWDDEVKNLLLDIRMPQMDGTELCHRLRKQLPKHVKIFALTAQAMPEERSIILQQGFDGLLMKPFKEANLLALIQNDNKGKNGEEFDISNIEKMTMGDAEQTAKILTRFIEDSLNDIAALHTGLENDDLDSVVLIAHRIAGRTAQVGAKELAAKFRVAEIELDSEKSLTENKKAHLLKLTAQLQEFIVEAREYTYNVV
jgi:signal transduction histidine kinase/CheY-like chemotaxis protein